ncbi:MAG: phospholipase D-like domain-containing protein [Candidatus Thorarchaeota archaeon]
MIPEIEKKHFDRDLSKNQLTDVWVQRANSDSYSYQSAYFEDVWAIGPEKNFINELLESIKVAKDIICISSFIIGAEELEIELVNAAKRSVRVYILSAPKTILKNEVISEDDDNDVGTRINNYKAFLDKIAGWLLLRSADHFHSKFLLVDPHDSERAKGYLSTANFDSALWKNPEIGIRLNQKEIKALYNQFQNGFWDEVTGELLKKEMFRPIQSTPDWITTSKDYSPLLCTVNGPRTDTPVVELSDAILEFIASSKGPLYLSTYGIDIDHKIAQQLLEESTRRKITLIVRPRVEQKEVHSVFANSGVTVVGHLNQHAKAITAKRNGKVTAMVMSANLQTKGLDEGFETGISLDDQRAGHVNDILRDWEQTFPFRFVPTITLGEIDTSILVPVGHRFEPKEVQEQKTIDLLPVIQTTLDELDPPEFNLHDYPLVKSIRVQYDIKRPLLPSGAKLVENDTHELPIYKHKKRQFIAVSKTAQIPTAIMIKSASMPNAAIVVSRDS